MFSRIRNAVNSLVERIRMTCDSLAWRLYRAYFVQRCHLALFVRNFKRTIVKLFVRKLASTTVQIAKNELTTIALNVSPIAIPVLQTLGYWQALQAMVTVSYLLNGVVLSAYIGLFWQTFIILVVSTWVCFFLADKLKGLQARYLFTHSVYIR